MCTAWSHFSVCAHFSLLFSFMNLMNKSATFRCAYFLRFFTHHIELTRPNSCRMANMLTARCSLALEKKPTLLFAVFVSTSDRISILADLGGLWEFYGCHCFVQVVRTEMWIQIHTTVTTQTYRRTIERVYFNNILWHAIHQAHKVKWQTMKVLVRNVAISLKTRRTSIFTKWLTVHLEVLLSDWLKQKYFFY